MQIGWVNTFSHCLLICLNPSKIKCIKYLLLLSHVLFKITFVLSYVYWMQSILSLSLGSRCSIKDPLRHSAENFASRKFWEGCLTMLSLRIWYKMTSQKAAVVFESALGSLWCLHVPICFSFQLRYHLIIIILLLLFIYLFIYQNSNFCVWINF